MIVCGRKFCSTCGRWRHVHDFGCHQREPLKLYSKCRLCARDYLRDWHSRHPGRSAEYSRHWREQMTPERLDADLRRGRDYMRARRADPVTRERVRQQSRDAYWRVRSDQTRWAARLGEQRMNYRLRAMRNGHPIPTMSATKYLQLYGNGSGRVMLFSAGPIQAMIKQWLDPPDLIAELNGRGREASVAAHTRVNLAEISGVPDRRVRLILDGDQRWISLRVADMLCVALDMPLSYLYPAR